MKEAHAEIKILRKAVESLQQSKSVENFRAGDIFPLKTELEISEFERKCLDSSFRDIVVCTQCYIH